MPRSRSTCCWTGCRGWRPGSIRRTAFAGTMHLEEGFWDIEAAYATTAGGSLPAVLPSEVYCHSISRSVDHERPSGRDADPVRPARPGRPVPRRIRRAAGRGPREAALIALQRHLAEPLLDCLARDADGQPCLDISSPVDLERSLDMPGGNIFHDDLSWPWLADRLPGGHPGRPVRSRDRRQPKDSAGRCRQQAGRRGLRARRCGRGRRPARRWPDESPEVPPVTGERGTGRAVA